jgi:hypothetical protein
MNVRAVVRSNAEHFWLSATGRTGRGALQGPQNYPFKEVKAGDGNDRALARRYHAVSLYPLAFERVVGFDFVIVFAFFKAAPLRFAPYAGFLDGDIQEPLGFPKRGVKA